MRELLDSSVFRLFLLVIVPVIWFAKSGEYKKDMPISLGIASFLSLWEDAHISFFTFLWHWLLAAVIAYFVYLAIGTLFGFSDKRRKQHDEKYGKRVRKQFVIGSGSYGGYSGCSSSGSSGSYSSSYHHVFGSSSGNEESDWERRNRETSEYLERRRQEEIEEDNRWREEQARKQEEEQQRYYEEEMRRSAEEAERRRQEEERRWIETRGW